MRRLQVGPISVWELACHLDEQDFRLARGNARKGRLFDILDDPLAEVMADVDCRAAVHPGRFDDRQAVRAILEQLDQVDSYNDLANRFVTITGEVRTICDIAAQTRRVFDAEEEAFVSAMRSRCGNYVETYGRSGAIALGGEAFCREAVALAHGLREDALSAGCDVSFATLAVRTILGAGYAVARACAYVGSVGEGSELPIDGNDLEDYLICLHPWRVREPDIGDR